MKYRVRLPKCRVESVEQQKNGVCVAYSLALSLPGRTRSIQRRVDFVARKFKNLHLGDNFEKNFPQKTRRIIPAYFQPFRPHPACWTGRTGLWDYAPIYPDDQGDPLYHAGRIADLLALYQKTALEFRASERARFNAFWKKHRNRLRGRRGLVVMAGWPADDLMKIDGHCEPFSRVRWADGDIFCSYPKDWFCLWQGVMWLDGRRRA